MKSSKLVFIVPIKSSQVSANWVVFSILVERALKSICQQTSDNFKVIAVCHEIPEIDFTHPNLEYLPVDFDPPTEENIKKLQVEEFRNGAKEADKAKKIMAGIAYAEKYNPDYIMVSDADDCISNKLVSFVEKQNTDSIGWYFKKGYIYNEGSNLIFLNKNTFNIICGTCIIVKAQYINALLDENPLPVYNHDFMAIEDKKLVPLPFNGAIYSIGNTENYCSTPEAVKKMQSGSIFSKGFIKNIFRKALKYRLKIVTQSFRNEYGLTKLDLTSVFDNSNA